MEEVLFDPQTSGGLLAAVKEDHAADLLQDLLSHGLPAAIVGEICKKEDSDVEICVKGL